MLSYLPKTHGLTLFCLEPALCVQFYFYFYFFNRQLDTTAANVQVPKASSGMMGQRICGWNFKHWEGDSARMNLINLPMMDSVVFKKLVDKSVATADASGTGNVGGEVQQSKKPSKRGVLPEAVSAELEELGIKKKRKVVAAQSEPQWHEPADDGNAPQISFGGDVDMDDESGSQQRNSIYNGLAAGGLGVSCGPVL